MIDALKSNKVAAHAPKKPGYSYRNASAGSTLAAELDG
jgi:hypothetical protein